MQVTIDISKGDAARLTRIAELRDWKDTLSVDEMISRCIGFAWLAAEKQKGYYSFSYYGVNQ